MSRDAPPHEPAAEPFPDAPARWPGGASIALFLASLTLTGFTVRGDAWPGWSILLFGFLGAFSGEPANWVWFCNPLLFAAWMGWFQGQRGLALGFSATALVGGLSVLACRVVMVSEAGGEGYEITSVGVGYGLWIASMLTLAAASVFAPMRREDRPARPQG